MVNSATVYQRVSVNEHFKLVFSKHSKERKDSDFAKCTKDDVVVVCANFCKVLKHCYSFYTVNMTTAIYMCM